MQKVQILFIEKICFQILKEKNVFADLCFLSLMPVLITGVASVNKYRVYN